MRIKGIAQILKDTIENTEFVMLEGFKIAFIFPSNSVGNFVVLSTL